MAHVTVTINGKSYRMACNEGEEHHLLALSERFDGYVTQLKGSFGEIGDQRLTVMAGVMITDELQEIEKRVRSLEADIATLKASRDEALGRAHANDTELTAQLVRTTERVEALAQRLGAAKSAD